MDVVKVVDVAIARLPDGDHSTGLKAVRRHIGASIRHFDRDGSGDIDNFTDAIYRTNQAFEGGLKEAYRVLAGKDPARLSPFEIENYLENHRIIRPRALKQLTRYREDYRNPSTHDYRPDFDEDEALLAIVAVCAFTKLLVNQISNKLAFDAAVSAAPIASINMEISTDLDLAHFILGVLSSAFRTTKLSEMTVEEVDGFVNGSLSAQGLRTEAKLEDDFEGNDWDILVKREDTSIPLEIRPIEFSDIKTTVHYMKDGLTTEKRSAGILLITPNHDIVEDFSLYSMNLDNNSKLYIISTSDIDLRLKSLGVSVLQSMEICANI